MVSHGAAREKGAAEELRAISAIDLFASSTTTQRCEIQSGRRGSNPRPSAWEADALPTELRPRSRPSLARPKERLSRERVVRHRGSGAWVASHDRDRGGL